MKDNNNLNTCKQQTIMSSWVLKWSYALMSCMLTRVLCIFSIEFATICVMAPTDCSWHAWVQLLCAFKTLIWTGKWLYTHSDIKFLYSYTSSVCKCLNIEHGLMFWSARWTVMTKDGYSNTPLMGQKRHDKQPEGQNICTIDEIASLAFLAYIYKCKLKPSFSGINSRTTHPKIK